MTLSQKLHLDNTPATVCAVGSGGKTTCLKVLAREQAELGRKVLLTTTTHMRREPETLLSSDPALLTEILEKGFLFVGAPAKEGKIGSLSPALLEQLRTQADITLIEADGSRMLPMKWPREGEPVLPEQVDLVLVLFGLSALGHPLSAVCQRWEMACDALQIDGNAPVTPELAARVLNEGYLKPLAEKGYACAVILNQADCVSAMDADALRASLCAPSFALSLREYPSTLPHA